MKRNKVPIPNKKVKLIVLKITKQISLTELKTITQLKLISLYLLIVKKSCNFINGKNLIINAQFIH